MSAARPEAHPSSARSEILLRASRHPLARLLSEGLDAAQVSADERVVLLVSGGGDSMALLVLMAALRERSDRSLGSLAVLSVDHGLRAESAVECAHAMAVARMLGVGRAETVRVDVARSGNLLDEARAARLAAVARFAERHAIGTAILAHHADDLAESILIGLSRGAGLASLAAILPRRDFGDGLHLVRPLLGARRAELRAFLEDVGVTWFDDASNALHARGRLRTEPALAALVESIAPGAGRLAAEARGLLEWRDAEIARQLSQVPVDGAMSREALAAVHPSVMEPLVKAFARRAGAELAPSVVASIADSIMRGDRAPRRFSCTDGCTVTLDARGLALVRDGAGRR